MKSVETGKGEKCCAEQVTADGLPVLNQKIPFDALASQKDDAE